MSTPVECTSTLTLQSPSSDQRTETPTINIESTPDGPTDKFFHQEHIKYETPDAKRRCDTEPHRSHDNPHRSHDSLHSGCHDNDTDSMPRSWCDSLSDISQCSSSNRPISLCVKYNDSEDNLLAIQSDMEALDQETNYEKLQRQFDNSKLTDIFDYEQEVQRRRSMSAIPTKQTKDCYVKGNETPTKSRVT